MLFVKRVLLALILLAMPFSAIAEKKLDWNDAELTWFDYTSGVQEIQRQKAKGLVVLYADWCPTCKKYSKLFKNKKVVKALDGLVLIRANVDTADEVAELIHYDGGYVPKTIALSSNGEVSKSIYPKKKEFMFYLDPKSELHLIKFINNLKKSKNI